MRADVPKDAAERTCAGRDAACGAPSRVLAGRRGRSGVSQAALVRAAPGLLCYQGQNGNSNAQSCYSFENRVWMQSSSAGERQPEVEEVRPIVCHRSAGPRSKKGWGRRWWQGGKLRRSGCGIVSLEAGDSAAKLPRKLSSFHRIFTYNFSPRPPGMSLLGCIVVFFFFFAFFLFVEERNFFTGNMGEKILPFSGGKNKCQFCSTLFLCKWGC